MAAGQLTGLRFAVPSTWTHVSWPEHDTLEIPGTGGSMRVLTLDVSMEVAASIPVLDIAQARLSSLYPAFRVESLMERPVAAGTSVEAMLRPRAGSALEPGWFFAVTVPERIVLVDYRRPDTGAHHDGDVQRFVHSLRRRGTSVRVAREFAEGRRLETRYQRRADGEWQVFLCHRSEDKPVVREVRDALFERGVVAWIDENDIVTGDRSVPAIEDGLARADAVLVMRGAQDLSSWQQLEYGVALNHYVRQERAGARSLKIVPVALPGSPPLREWAGFLGTFNGVEFTSKIHGRGISKLVEMVVPGGSAPEVV